MSDFVEHLRLAEKAAENIYFAKVNRELIESLHRRMAAEEELLSHERSSAEGRADESPAVMKTTRR